MKKVALPASKPTIMCRTSAPIFCHIDNGDKSPKNTTIKLFNTNNDDIVRIVIVDLVRWKDKSL